MTSNNCFQTFRDSISGQNNHVSQNGILTKMADSFTLEIPAAEDLSDVQSLPFSADGKSISAYSFCKASKKICKLDVQVDSSVASLRKRNRARNLWTPQEDAKLLELLKKYGQSWAMISSGMPGRTGKQIRDRYLNKLRPNIKCGAWSVEEDQLVVRLINEVGKRWSLIANHLSGRTEGQVKNRYYSCLKKRLESLASSQPSTTRSVSEAPTSVAACSETEEKNCKFRFDFNVDMSAFVHQEPALLKNSYTVNRGAYVFEEQSSEENYVKTEWPYKYTDPTSVISYDAHHFQRAQSIDLFAPAIEDGNKIDSLLDWEDFRSDNYPSSVGVQGNSNGTYLELCKRGAFFESVLAKTLEKIKNLEIQNKSSNQS